jgi:hypothetical protein
MGFYQASDSSGALCFALLAKWQMSIDFHQLAAIFLFLG